MKIECVKEKLEKALGSAEKITGKNVTLPVLKCIYLDGQKNNLTIRATNLDLGIEINIPVKAETEGVVAVPGNIIYSFISNIKDEKNVTLEEVEGNLKLSTSHHSTLIKCYPTEDFPIISKIEDGKKFTISSSDLVKGFKAVSYSASISSMKPELSSVYVYPDNDGLVFVATDAFRLAEKKVKSKKVIDFPPVLIPFKNVAEITRILEGRNEEVEVVVEKHQISFLFGEVYLTSRIIDGVFPQYHNLIPKESATEAVVLKQDLINSLKIANVFSDKFNKVTIKVDPRGKIFELKTRNNDIGESSNLLAGSLEGEGIEISFNYKNITDAFSALESDSISLAFNGLNKPLSMRGVSDRSFVYIVMPMNK
jgi:DNA polymerase III subunit beta